MRLIEQKRLGFEDVTLISESVSTIESRDDIQLSLDFCNTKLSVPILASPMKSVCDGTVAKIMAENGGMGIIHRFCSVEEQVKEYKLASSFNKNVGCAIGVNTEPINLMARFDILYMAGCRIFCIDVANGASTRVQKEINQLLEDPLVEDAKFIVGNVVSAEQYIWCSELPNVCACRVGISGGSACTTKNATGIYDKPISLISECHRAKDNLRLNTIIIADGGIGEVSHAVKAIAAGADVVMLGAEIAKTVESPAELLKVPLPNGEFKFYKVHNGSASEENQKLYKDTPKYIEGKSKLLEYHNEPLVKVLNRYVEGLKSSMSYFNARTIEEFRRNVIFGLT